MYDKTVTVFNKYTDKSDAIYWYPHVISGVTLITDKAANVAKTGLDTADTANLHVPFKVREGERIVCNLSYLTPKVWKTTENKENSITFSTGDIFLEGEYPETVIADEDYTSRTNKGFYDYLNKKMDNVFLITSVGSYTLIPHFEIGGK